MPIEYLVSLPLRAVEDLDTEQKVDAYLHHILQRAWHSLKGQLKERQLDALILHLWQSEDLL